MKTEEIKKKINILLISENEEEYEELKKAGCSNIDRFKSIIRADKYFRKNPDKLNQYHLALLGNSTLTALEFYNFQSLDYLVHHREDIIDGFFLLKCPRTVNGGEIYSISMNKRIEAFSYQELIDKIISQKDLEEIIKKYPEKEQKRSPVTDYENPNRIPLPKKKEEIKILYLDAISVNPHAEEIAEELGLNVTFKEDNNFTMRDHIRQHLGEYDIIIANLWDEYELTRREARASIRKIDDIQLAKRRLDELKLKIRSLGTINVSAIDEYKELLERYNFLINQVKDIENVKKELSGMINDLTTQMKKIFLERFEEISKNFSSIFSQLFGGGNASLSLVEPDDILNSGIDIIVQPPGKIISYLESLSGGEKSLIAIALYFSIMKVSPPPFCVLDEIEASLDDVNVDRFASYLHNISDKTQFIVITHRRGTMEEADMLYGITMQDEGVSKILELRVYEVEQKLGI